MLLYHFTSFSNLDHPHGTILKEGLKPGGDEYCPPIGVIWFTSNSDPVAMFFSGDEPPTTVEWKLAKCRITVDLSPNSKRLMRWETWLRKQDVIELPGHDVPVEQYINTLTQHSGMGTEWRAYWVYFGSIPFDKIRAIEPADPQERVKKPAANPQLREDAKRLLEGARKR